MSAPPALENQAEAAPPPPRLSKEWYVIIKGEACGPYSVSDIGTMLTNRDLTNLDLASKAGGAQWAPLNTIPEFYPFMVEARIGAAKQKGKEAVRNAFSALKIFAVNPAGGLSQAYEGLGEQPATAVGIVYAIGYLILVLFSIRVVIPKAAFQLMSVSLFNPRLIITILAPYFGLLIALSMIRAMLAKENHYSAVFFICGAMFLPIGIFNAIYSLLLSIFTSQSGDFAAQTAPAFVIITCCMLVFSVCYTTITLFSGLTRVLRIKESSGTILAPAAIVGAFAVTYLIVKALFA